MTNPNDEKRPMTLLQKCVYICLWLIILWVCVAFLTLPYIVLFLLDEHHKVDEWISTTGEFLWVVLIVFSITVTKKELF